MTITRDEALDRHERLMLELIRKGGFISDVGRVGLLELKAPFPDDDPSWAKNERARALAAARVAIDGGMLLESSAHAMSVEVEAAEAVHAWLQLTPWREEYDFRIMKIYGWDRYRAKAWVEPAASPIAPTATALLAKLLRELRGTPESFSAADERGYVQAAGLADGGLHVEIASDRYLALPLRPREEAAMRQLGSTNPRAEHAPIGGCALARTTSRRWTSRRRPLPRRSLMSTGTRRSTCVRH